MKPIETEGMTQEQLELELKSRLEWKEQEERRKINQKLLEDNNYGHDFDVRDRRCILCGLSEAEFVFNHKPVCSKAPLGLKIAGEAK